MDILLKTAYAIKIQGKKLLSRFDSKAYIGILGAAILAIEDEKSIRIGPAQKKIHSELLKREEPKEDHLKVFYERMINKTIVDYFQQEVASDSTNLIKSLEKALKERDFELKSFFDKFREGEIRDNRLLTLLIELDLASIVIVPVREEIKEIDKKEKEFLEALSLLWILFFVN